MRLTQPRRTLEQIKHCVEEALSAYEHNEDPRHVRDDLRQARELLEQVLPMFVDMAKGAARDDAAGDDK